MKTSSITGEMELTKEEFLTLSAADKRVVLAKDVLRYMDLRWLHPFRGRYFHPVYTNLFEFNAIQDLREIVKQSNCYVCALGALFIAAVIYNKDPEYCFMLKHSGSIRKILNSYFSQNQLSLIEMAFEGSSIYSIEGQTPDTIVAAITFSDNCYTGEIMTSIMDNIITNNGEFDPTKEHHE